MAKRQQPQQEWYRPFALDDPKSDFWQADVKTPVGEYRLTVTTTDTGLYPGGRWSWVMKSPRGRESASDKGFRSERSAKLAAEDYLVRVLSDAVVRAGFEPNPDRLTVTAEDEEEAERKARKFGQVLHTKRIGPNKFVVSVSRRRNPEAGVTESELTKRLKF